MTATTSATSTLKRIALSALAAIIAISLAPTPQQAHAATGGAYAATSVATQAVTGATQAAVVTDAMTLEEKYAMLEAAGLPHELASLLQPGDEITADGKICRHIDLDATGITVADQLYYGKSLAPDIKLGGRPLVDQVDRSYYSVALSAVSGGKVVGNKAAAPGRYKLTLSYADTHDDYWVYKGEAARYYIVKYDANRAIKSGHVTASNLIYTGKALAPSVTVKVGSKTLKAGSDYTLTVRNASGKAVSKITAAGTYKATVEGTGNGYHGTVTKGFTVKSGNDLTASGFTVKAASFKYTGKAQNARVTVKKGNSTLKQGRDYKVTIKTLKNKPVAKNKPKARGTYIAYVTGKGSYSGTVAKKFKLYKEVVYKSFYNDTKKDVDDIKKRMSPWQLRHKNYRLYSYGAKRVISTSSTGEKYCSRLYIKGYMSIGGKFDRSSENLSDTSHTVKAPKVFKLTPNTKHSYYTGFRADSHSKTCYPLRYEKRYGESGHLDLNCPLIITVRDGVVTEISGSAPHWHIQL